VAVLAESVLRSRGLNQLEAYEPVAASGLSALITTSSNEPTALSWAREAGYEYALSGTVHEWHWGFSSLSTVGQKLVKGLLGNVRIKKSS